MANQEPRKEGQKEKVKNNKNKTERRKVQKMLTREVRQSIKDISMEEW